VGKKGYIMKIAITAEKTTVNAMIDTMVDVVNEFRPDGISESEIRRIKRNLGESSQEHRGPATVWQYHTDLGEYKQNCGVSITIEDEAVQMALPMAIKIAQVISPLYDMCKAGLKMIHNMQAQFTAIGNEFTKQFQKMYNKPKLYAIGVVWCEDLEAFDMVVVEDNQFGNRRTVYAEHCGKVNSMSVIHKLAMKAIERGDATKDSATKRYPYWEFKQMSREEAEKICKDFRKNLQSDVDGYYRSLKTDEDGKD